MPLNRWNEKWDLIGNHVAFVCVPLPLALNHIETIIVGHRVDIASYFMNGVYPLTNVAMNID